MNFNFDPVKHLYTVNDRPVPSVTQVLSAVGIIPDFRFVDREVLERKRQIGTALHACLHYLQEGELDPETVDPEVRPHLEAYQLFVEESGFKALECEIRRYPIVNRMCYGMTADVCGTINGVSYLIDFKTSKGVPQEGWAIQLVAYREGLAVPRVPPFKWRRMTLQLLENGNYLRHEWDDPGDRQEWLSALYLVTRRMNRGFKPWEENH